MIQLIGNGLLILSMLLGLECIRFYHVSTRGMWRHSAVGRHLMAFMAVLSAVLVVSVIRIFGFDSTWFSVLRVALFAGVPVVFAWRRILMGKAFRRDNDTPGQAVARDRR